MTKQEMARVLAILKEYYPRDVASTDLKAKVEAWYLVLHDYPESAVTAAVVAFAADDTKGFPPSVGQINAMTKDLLEKQRSADARRQDVFALQAQVRRITEEERRMLE